MKFVRFIQLSIIMIFISVDWFDRDGQFLQRVAACIQSVDWTTGLSTNADLKNRGGIEA
jgi:hypothetical protein